mmetsp:Transcript_15250/g.36150  ORF Transcript_15250/g.36150 Transcript_15250/m.36150 type:complete len:202 (-) Transcript_15250:592-1197(-)
MLPCRCKVPGCSGGPGPGRASARAGRVSLGAWSRACALAGSTCLGTSGSGSGSISARELRLRCGAPGPARDPGPGPGPGGCHWLRLGATSRSTGGSASGPPDPDSTAAARCVRYAGRRSTTEPCLSHTGSSSLACSRASSSSSLASSSFFSVRSRCFLSVNDPSSSSISSSLRRDPAFSPNERRTTFKLGSVIDLRRSVRR